MSSEQPPKRAARALTRGVPGALAAAAVPAAPHVASALAGSSPWAYAPAPESKELALIRPRYGLFIDGQERAPANGEVVVTYNPATEEPLAEVAKGSAEDADRAISAADRAHRKSWSKLAPRERAKYLYRISRILQERSREFAVTETLDSGKPIRESRDVDVPLAAAHFWYYAGWADKLQYAVPGRRPESHGVVGQVIPWNFPLLMLA
ncbi:MAG: aldehyde dehydrogenase family protein, partial [Candidatus Limnocylindrus sp.]